MLKRTKVRSPVARGRKQHYVYTFYNDAPQEDYKRRRVSCKICNATLIRDKRAMLNHQKAHPHSEPATASKKQSQKRVQFDPRLRSPPPRERLQSPPPPKRHQKRVRFDLEPRLIKKDQKLTRSYNKKLKQEVTTRS